MANDRLSVTNSRGLPLHHTQERHQNKEGGALHRYQRPAVEMQTHSRDAEASQHRNDPDDDQDSARMPS